MSESQSAYKQACKILLQDELTVNERINEVYLLFPKMSPQKQAHMRWLIEQLQKKEDLKWDQIQD